MNNDTLPSTPHHGLARPSQALSLPNAFDSRLGSTSPLLIVNGPDDSEPDVPPLGETVMNGALTSNSEDADMNATSGSQLSRSTSQERDTTEAATLQGLQRATAALESIKERERTRELSAVARARKTAAFRSPIATSVRYRSIAGTPVPNPFSPKLRDESLTVTAGSSRATSPSRTPSGRAKRRKKTPIPASNSSLLSIDANDRRRSARVAKATVTVPTDGASHTPNLSQFGFSPFLENLVMGAREHDRRTRSGVRATRPVAAPTKAKRPPPKTKSKDKDPDLDSSGLEAKKELFRQLCILSYQLQAELDMVPFKTLDQLEADLDTPPPEDDPSGFKASTTMNGTSLRPSYEAPGMFANSIKAEPAYSRAVPSDYGRPGFSLDSSPEVSLVDSAKTAYPSYHDTYDRRNRRNLDVEYYAPLSPEPRPSRSNIMSISALMDDPAPKRPRYRTPTPEPPIWTYEDDNATQILADLLAMKPKLDTTELDRLAQIVQLAAFDFELPSRAGSPDSEIGGVADDPLTLNPLRTFDMQQLFDSEEVAYLEEKSACGELYASLPHLTSFDDVVDEWRAGELSRLRLELQYRRAEIERIWTCERKLAWSNFINDRAGELYRKQAVHAHHQKWQAQMELDLLSVHRRKTRAVAKLTEQIWLPKNTDIVGEKEKELYAKYGSFVHGSKHAGLEDPLVRGDLDRLRLARSMQHQELAQDDAEMSLAVGAIEDEVGMEEVVSDDGSSESEYESDFSLSSGISSLPSFSSLSQSPISLGIKDADPEETASTSVDADSDDDSDPAKAQGDQGDLDDPIVNGDSAHAAAARPKIPLRRQSPKRKKPPPPGARLWKQGQVQHDEMPADAEPEPAAHEVAPSDPFYYAERLPAKTMLNGDEAWRQAQQHEEELRYAEHQRMLYEQQMYEYEHQRHFYADPGPNVYYAPREVHENGDIQHRRYYPSYHPHHQPPPPHAFTQVPTGHHSHWPY